MAKRFLNKNKNIQDIQDIPERDNQDMDYQDDQFYQEDQFDEQFDQNQQSYLDEIQKKPADILKAKRRSKQFYIKKDDLMAQLHKYRESKKQHNGQYGVISEQLGKMILKICTRFSLHPKFFGYSYRDQMVADAVCRCILKGLDHINLQLANCNPFSYFTQIAYNCFRARINSEKKQAMIKQKYRDQVYRNFEKSQGTKHMKNMESKDEDSQNDSNNVFYW